MFFFKIAFFQKCGLHIKKCVFMIMVLFIKLFNISLLILLILYLYCDIDTIYSFSVCSLVLICFLIELSHFNRYFIVCLSMLWCYTIVSGNGWYLFKRLNLLQVLVPVLSSVVVVFGALHILLFGVSQGSVLMTVLWSLMVYLFKLWLGWWFGFLIGTYITSLFLSLFTAMLALFKKHMTTSSFDLLRME